jgi:hypothetical protein
MRVFVDTARPQNIIINREKETGRLDLTIDRGQTRNIILEMLAEQRVNINITSLALSTVPCKE